MSKEVWKDIPGYEGYYQASCYGRVRSIDRFVRLRAGVKRIARGRVMKVYVSKNGYAYVELSKDGRPVLFRVHQLIMWAFHGRTERGFNKNRTINHIDGNKVNNILRNLEYCTQLENTRKAVALGLTRPRRKPVICLNDGRVYESIKACSSELRLWLSSVSAVCNHLHRTASGVRLMFLSEFFQRYADGIRAR